MVTLMESTARTGQAVERAGLDLAGSLDGRDVRVRTDNADVIEALSRFDDASRGVLALIEIGAHAALAASTGFDINDVRREVNRVVGETTIALSGVRQEVIDAVGDEGPLARSLLAASEKLAAAMSELVHDQSDPDVPGTLLAKLAGHARTFEESLASARKQIADDLSETADKYSDGLNKALREMRDLDPASALGRAFSGIEKGLKEMSDAMAASAAARSERQRGTAKGGDYEELVAAEVAAIAAVYGDRAERTGQQAGALVKKDRALRGDITCFAGEKSIVAIEAMNRGKAQVTGKKVAEELEEAKANRGTPVAIAVVSSGDNGLMCRQALQPMSPTTWAVVLDAEDPDPLALQLAYRFARDAAMKPEDADNALDASLVRDAIDEINSKLSGLTAVRTQLANIQKCRDNADVALLGIERDIRESVLKLATAVEQD